MNLCDEDFGDPCIVVFKLSNRHTGKPTTPVLIPYAARPVMWNCFFASVLLFFCQVVEEEVDQDSVDLGFWLEFDDLATQLLNGPNTASCIEC
jgi:hypothetical protein